jgi:hypothetical protein
MSYTTTRNSIKVPIKQKYSYSVTTTNRSKNKISHKYTSHTPTKVNRIAGIMIGTGLVSSVFCLGLIFVPSFFGVSKTASADSVNTSMRIVTNYLSDNTSK